MALQAAHTGHGHEHFFALGKSVWHSYQKFPLSHCPS